MDQQPVQHGLSAEPGFATVQWLAMAGGLLVLFMALGNALLWHYARGAVAVAADEGARAGSVLGASTGDCEAAAWAVLDPDTGLLRGRFAGTVDRVDCRIESGEVIVEVAGAFPWLMDAWPVPDLAYTVEARAVREVLP